jgi:hypothetical protein
MDNKIEQITDIIALKYQQIETQILDLIFTNETIDIKIEELSYEIERLRSQQRINTQTAQKKRNIINRSNERIINILKNSNNGTRSNTNK